MSCHPSRVSAVQTDEWLEAQCRTIEESGRRLAELLGQINARLDPERRTARGRRPRVTEAHLRRAEALCAALHQVQVTIQNHLFDCEHELRELREREISPAELLIDGERLILRYRFLRRRARVLDGLLAYLPAANSDAHRCLERLRRLRAGAPPNGPLVAPDCSFALVALDVLREEAVPAG